MRAPVETGFNLEPAFSLAFPVLFCGLQITHQVLILSVVNYK